MFPRDPGLILLMSQRMGEAAALWSRLCPGVTRHSGRASLRCEHGLLLFPQVLLRVKESEIQYLKQEISSLKDELQTALRVMPGMVLRSSYVLCSSVCLHFSSLRARFEAVVNVSPAWG